MSRWPRRRHAYWSATSIIMTCRAARGSAAGAGAGTGAVACAPGRGSTGLGAGSYITVAVSFVVIKPDTAYDLAVQLPHATPPRIPRVVNSLNRAHIHAVAAVQRPVPGTGTSTN
jgi:hypothetical protein